MFTARDYTTQKAASRGTSRRQGARPAAPRHGSAEFLQRHLGNNLFQQIATAGSPVVQRKCASCSDKDNDTGHIQTKLTVGPADDAYEREADRVAEQVLRGDPVGPLRGVSEHPQRKSASCKAEEKETLRRQVDKEEELRFKPEASGPQAAGAAAAASAVAAGGQPLSPAELAYFEPRFGRDFGGVRVHVGTRAAEAARSLVARAFTVGRNVAFGAGQYAPGTPAGKRLLAHELTHVVQQDGTGVQAKLTVSQPGDIYEQEADQVAKAVLQRQMLGPEEEKEEEPVLAKLNESRVQRKDDEEVEGAFKQRQMFFTDFETKEKRPFKKDTNWGTVFWPAEDDSTFELFFVGSFLELPKMRRGVGELEGHMSMKDFRDEKLENETYYPRLDFKLVWNQSAPENPLNLKSPVPADYDSDGGGTTKVLVTYAYGGYTEDKHLGKMGDHTLALTFVYSSNTSETSEASAEVGGSYKGVETKGGFSESVTVSRAAISWTWEGKFRTYSPTYS